MHYHCEVWFPGTPESRISSLQLLDKTLAVYSEDRHSKKAFYDWYVIGGRWAGVHDSYKPCEDYKNYSTCEQCQGSGNRKDSPNDMKWSRGCNGCRGTGIKRNWNNHPYKGDVMLLSDVKEDIGSYSLIIVQGRWPKIFHKEKWTGTTFTKTEYSVDNLKEFLKDRGITDGYLVTVDYHC